MKLKKLIYYKLLSHCISFEILKNLIYFSCRCNYVGKYDKPNCFKVFSDNLTHAYRPIFIVK